MSMTELKARIAAELETPDNTPAPLTEATPAELAEALPLIPRDIEAEISGGVTLETIRVLALACPERPADFISVGRITHSAPSADFSMKMERGKA